MPFDVTTRDSAIEEVAHYWSRVGVNRKAVTIALDEIDQALRDNPFQGVKHANSYHFTKRPLTAVYDVIPLEFRIDILQFLYHG